MAPSKSKAKDVVKPVLGFSSNSTCNLPLWDDAHILQENWGAPLVAVAGAMPVAKEARPSKVNKDGTSGAFYTDAEGRTVLQRFIQYYGKDCSPITAELALHAANEGAESPPGSGEVPPRLTPDATPKEEDPPLVEWQRPVDIVRPFRPVVHRNLTPYIDPYASTEELHPVDAKAEEARCRAESAAIQSTAGGKRGDAASKGADVAPVAPLFELYPETVSLIEDLVGQDVGMWQNLHSAEAIRRYRELPALIEPYDPTLTAGCSETPAEACRSRYSTALRYKLQRAEALSALKHIPPFFMSAFNSILLAVEHSQHLVSSGNYLWELIYPHAPGTCHPVYNPFGKYAVKLFVEGAYRKVLVDDALPVDELGRPLISLTARKELWPAILAKAIFKALGPDSHRAMRDHPEQLLSCLMGNWVPQYVATKQDPVATAALLLRYRLRLPSYQESIGKLNEVIPNTQRPQTASVKSPAGANKKSSRASPIADPGEKPQEKKRSSSRKGNKKETPPIPPPLESLAETEAVPINTEEVADTRPMVLCGLRTSTPTDQFGLGSGAQMYTIVDIAPFRNTLAIHMTTTPRTNIVGGLFERERDAKDVRDLVISTKHREGESQVVKDAAIVHCWVTLEELGDILDALVIWRNFDQRYQNQVCIEYPSDASRLTTNQPSKKVSAAQAAAMAAAQSLIRAPKRYTVMWWSLTTVKAEEVAIVSHAPQPPPVPTAEELALAVTPPPSSQSRKAPAAPKAPKQAGGPKKSKNAHEEPPQPVPEPDEQVDTTRWTGNHTSLVVPGSVPNEPKLIQLDYYLWDKADPISQSITTFYEYGKLCSSVFSLAAGQHIFRLTIPEMEQDEKITLLSDGTMEMKTDLGDILKLCNVFCLSDAGSFPAVERADEESVWFKRKLRVSAPTRLTMVLSTLLPGEDPAAHRHLLAAPPAAKGQKGGGGGNSGRSGQSNKQAAQAAKDSSDDVDHRVCDIPILRYTRLTLMNLDSREETHVGEVGRLAQIDLEPNNRGYLLMAHVLIPSEDAEAVQAAFQSFVVGTSPPPAEDGTTAATSPHQPSLYGKGVWKMALRSDRELAGFDAVAYNTVLYQDKGSLGRGGGAVLFRQSCTVTESSHLTVLADFKVTQAELYVPITLRITNADAAIPSSAGNFVAASPIATKTPAREVTPPVESPDAPHLAIETVVFETTVYGGHIFVPDVFLELPERSRSSAYVVEGFVPEEFASQWDEECRQAQEDKFLASRVEAEKHTSEQRLRELEEISADPNVFVVKKREQQQQQQAAQELAEKSVKETVAPSSKRRRSIDRKKFASTTRNNTPSAAETQEATTKASTSVSTPSPAVPLDTVNSDLLITFSLSLLLSSVKTDVRTMMPAEDYLLLLRDHWKGVPRNQNAPPVEVSSGTSSKGQAANTASSKAKQHQREVAAAEEVLHTEQARQSRQRFLENPRNELLPYVMEEGNAVRSSHGRELPSSKLGTVVPVVISEDGEFNNFKHAPPFDPEDYKVRLLPIRAFELCEASHVEMNIGSHLGASTNGQPGGAKESKRTRNLSMKQSMALSAATSMSVLPSSTQFSPSAAAEEDDTSALREPLVQSMEHYQMAFLTIRNAQKIERQQMKQHVYQYWQSHPTRTVEETPHSAGDAPMSPLMNNYTSIIGTKEDDNPKRVKSLVS